ncbi:hypothetical protein BC941DRAFT_419594 [Chlamydoabsidia padenii]|nr:hypothetical protein BC941DRAFT_419594 [Chlamydoabsidia padenii]
MGMANIKLVSQGASEIIISCNIGEHCAAMNAINNQPPSKYNNLVFPWFNYSLE